MKTAITRARLALRSAMSGRAVARLACTVRRVRMALAANYEAEVWFEQWRAADDLARKAAKRADEADDVIEWQGEQLAHLRRLLDDVTAESEGYRAELAWTLGLVDDARRERDTAREQVNEGIEALLAMVRDPANGSTVRGRLALGVLRQILAEQHGPSALLLRALLAEDGDPAEALAATARGPA